jgi:hypothetical protein
MSNRARVAGASGCCVLAAASPLVAGSSTAVAGLVPVAVAGWLLAVATWSTRTRLVAGAILVVATVGLAALFLVAATTGSGE